MQVASPKISAFPPCSTLEAYRDVAGFRRNLAAPHVETGAPIMEPTKRDGSDGQQACVEPLKILTRPE